MTNATSTLFASSPPPGDFASHSQINLAEYPARLRRYRLALALYITSVIMLFVGLSSAYVVRRGIPTYEVVTGAYSTSWEPLPLPVGLLLVNTLWLLGSSAAMEVARRNGQSLVANWEEKKAATFGWIHLSLLFSLGFVVGQAIAWRMLRSGGHFLVSGARTAFFYVLSGTHAMHAILGIGLLAWIVARQRRWLPARRFFVVDLTAWYLHAMTVLWIYLFAFLMFV